MGSGVSPGGRVSPRVDTVPNGAMELASGQPNAGYTLRSPQRGILFPETRQTGYHVTMIELHRWHATSVRAQQGANRT